MKKFLSAVMITFLFAGLTNMDTAQAETFKEWLENFKAHAITKGISKKTCETAFGHIDSVNAEILEKTRYQAEVIVPAWSYFDNFIHEQAVQTGKEMAKKWEPWLKRIEKEYGVDRYILLAIWSVETRYGEVLDNPGILHDVVHAVATLAYADPKRSKLMGGQLMAVLEILEEGKMKRPALVGSWAGAMGHTQFIPTSYLTYRVDIDGDGHSNIWNSIPDALATAANLLKKNNWKTGQGWGHEAYLPVSNPPSEKMTCKEWKRLGLKVPKEIQWQNDNVEAQLIVLDEEFKGPSFLVMNNFYVLKRYNNSDKYAITVGLLADEIAGKKKRPWDHKRPFKKLMPATKKELQQHLQKLGFYSGKIDGKIGGKATDAIRNFQKNEGLTADGYPSLEILNHIRKKKEISSKK